MTNVGGGLQTLPMTKAPNSPYKDAVINELEELRQRGLAKSLTKHFTQSIKELEAELASADAALRDLEARKAQAKDFAPSANELTQLDMMYMKVSEWKKQCRMREQETVMLYRRYVEKFGNHIKLATPEDLMTPKKGFSSSSSTSPLATADVAELAKVFEEAGENGIPHFLRPVGTSSSPLNAQALEEILEEESLQDPDAPCKSFGISPRTTVTAAIDSDCDDSSVVSGLTTLNSQVTREVLKEVENKVLDFIKQETSEIRRLLEEEDAASKAAPSVGPTSLVGSIADQSATNAENMVLAMQKILEEFKHQEAETKKAPRTIMVRRIDTGNEEEEWYEHFDQTFQTNFYVETNSNTTQWHMPPSMTDLSSSDSSTSVCESAAGTSVEASMMTTAKVLDYSEFRPESKEMRSSTRIAQYRKKLRRQRNRRIVAFLLAVALGGAVFAYCKYTHPEELEKIIETASAKVASTVDWTTSAPSSVVSPKQTKTKVEAPKKGSPVPAKVEADVVLAKEQDKPKKPQVETNDSITTEAVETPLFADAPVEQMEKHAAAAVVVQKQKEVEPKVQEKQIEQTHWMHSFFVALLGPVEFKEVNAKCREPARYCGNYAP